MKLIGMENRAANPIANSLQSNSAGNGVNPSDPGTLEYYYKILKCQFNGYAFIGVSSNFQSTYNALIDFLVSSLSVFQIKLL